MIWTYMVFYIYMSRHNTVVSQCIVSYIFFTVLIIGMFKVAFHCGKTVHFPFVLTPYRRE